MSMLRRDFAGSLFASISQVARLVLHDMMHSRTPKRSVVFSPVFFWSLSFRVIPCVFVCVHAWTWRPLSERAILLQGSSACLTVTAQRRHCHFVVTSGLISQTYLLSD